MHPLSPGRLDTPPTLDVPTPSVCATPPHTSPRAAMRILALHRHAAAPCESQASRRAPAGRDHRTASAAPATPPGGTYSACSARRTEEKSADREPNQGGYSKVAKRTAEQLGGQAAASNRQPEASSPQQAASRERPPTATRPRRAPRHVGLCVDRHGVLHTSRAFHLVMQAFVIVT